MVLSPTSQKFLAELNDKLVETGASPLLLRNYKTLPQEIGNDLDIFVKRSKQKKAIRIVLDQVLKFGGGLGHIHRRDYFTAIWFKFEDEERFWHIDVYPGAFSWHGLSYLEEHDVLSASRNFTFWKVPSAHDEALLIFLTSVMWGGHLKDRYRPVVCELLSGEDAFIHFSGKFINTFGKNVSEWPRRIADGSYSSEDLAEIGPVLRRSLKKSRILKSPVGSLFRLGRHWFGEIRAYLISPPGLEIDIEGLAGYHSEDAIKEILSLAGAFFGGILVESSRDSSKRPSWLKRKVSLGKNFLVVRKGASIKVRLPEEEISGVQRFLEKEVQRILFKRLIRQEDFGDPALLARERETQ